MSFLSGPPFPEEIRKYKKKMKYKIQKLVKKNQFEMLRIEVMAVTACEGLGILRSILLQRFT